MAEIEILPDIEDLKGGRQGGSEALGDQRKMNVSSTVATTLETRYSCCNTTIQMIFS